MGGSLPKVLTKTTQKSLLDHVVETSLSLAPERIVVVTGYQRELVEASLETTRAAHKQTTDFRFAYQKELLGTGHAVQQALPALEGLSGHPPPFPRPRSRLYL